MKLPRLGVFIFRSETRPDRTCPLRSGPLSGLLSNSVFGLIPGWTGQSGGLKLSNFFFLPGWRRHGQTVPTFLYFLFLICPVFQVVRPCLVARADRATTLSVAKQKAGPWSVRSGPGPVKDRSGPWSTTFPHFGLRSRPVRSGTDAHHYPRLSGFGGILKWTTLSLKTCDNRSVWIW